MPDPRVRTEFTGDDTNLRAVSRRASQAIGNVGRRANQAADRMSKFNRAIRGAGMVVFAAAAARAARALSDMVYQQASLARGLVDMSNAFGTTTRRLELFRNVLRLAGQSTQNTDLYLRRISVRLDEARRGGERAALAFKVLGVELENADGTTRDLVDVTLDAIRATSGLDRATANYAASLIVGTRYSQSFVELAGDHSGALDDLIQRANKVTTATDAQNAKLSEAAVRFDEVRIAMEQAIKTEIAENIDGITDALTNLVKVGTTAIRVLGHLFELEEAPGRAYQRAIEEMRKEAEDAVRVVGPGLWVPVVEGAGAGALAVKSVTAELQTLERVVIRLPDGFDALDAITRPFDNAAVVAQGMKNLEADSAALFASWQAIWAANEAAALSWGDVQESAIDSAVSGFARLITEARSYEDILRSLGSLTQQALGILVEGGLRLGLSTVPGLGFLAGGRFAGGHVAGGSAYVVGEHGPELFVPEGSGTILPDVEGAGATVVEPVIIFMDHSETPRNVASARVRNEVIPHLRRVYS